MVEGGGFEPPKAEPSDLQSDPFGHSGTPPRGHFITLVDGIRSLTMSRYALTWVYCNFSHITIGAVAFYH